MDTMICPGCKNVVPKSEKCPKCGYPIALIEKKKIADMKEAENQFFDAFLEADYDKVLKCYGVLEYMGANLEDVIPFLNMLKGDYELAYNNILRCRNQHSEWTPYIALCLAMQGKICDYIKLFSGYKIPDLFQLLSLFFEGVRKSQYDEWYRFCSEFERNTPQFDRSLIEKIKTDKSEAKLLSLFGTVLAETLEEVTSVTRYQLATSQKVEFDEKKQVCWQKNQFILAYYKALYPSKSDLVNLLARNEIAISEGNWKELKSINSELASVFEELFITDNPEGRDAHNVLSFLDIITIMEEEDTLRSWEKYAGTIQECLISKDKLLTDKIIELLSIIDARSLLNNIGEGSKLNYIYKYVKMQEEYQYKVLNQRAWIIIHDESRIALQAADWYYNKAIKSDYGMFDAGLISLAYFRVIEVELNIRLIWHMLYSLRYNLISKQYQIAKKKYFGDNKKYEKKWSTFLKKLHGVDDYISGKGNTSGFELGTLRNFLKMLRTESDIDPLRDILRAEIEKRMTDLGKEAYRNGRIEEIISDEALQKYRNPPAHTRYLC